jgi:hypothetical protein
MQRKIDELRPVFAAIDADGNGCVLVLSRLLVCAAVNGSLCGATLRSYITRSEMSEWHYAWRWL